MQKVILENVRIGFRNFQGKESKYNPKGRRNFCVFLDDDTAEEMAKDGWNIKYLVPRSEDETAQAYMQVAVNFANMPPSILMISNGQRIQLDEDSVDILDWADIESVDIIINPYEWEVSGKSGVKAYLKKMYVTIEDDPLASKYWEPDEYEESE